MVRRLHSRLANGVAAVCFNSGKPIGNIVAHIGSKCAASDLNARLIPIAESIWENLSLNRSALDHKRSLFGNIGHPSICFIAAILD